MALSKYTAFLLDSNSYFAQDIILSKDGISDKNRSRQKAGEFHIKYKDIRRNNQEFYEYTGVSMQVFDYILENVKEPLTTVEASYRAKGAIYPEEKLVLTLRYLSSGCSYTELATSFCMGISTVGQLVAQTSEVIWESLNQLHMPKTSTEYLQSLTALYWTKWHFPNCIGAIGERTVKGRQITASSYPMYVIQGIADANYKFVAVEVIGKRSKNEDTFSSSKLNLSLENNTFGVPPSQNAPNSQTLLPNVIIADVSYPLTRYMLRPFYKRNLTSSMLSYNERLDQARTTIKCAYEILFSKWKFLSKTLATSGNNTKLTIKAALLLHNVVCDIDGYLDQDYQKGLENFNEPKCCPRKKNNRPTIEAKKVRNLFVDYFENNLQQE